MENERFLELINEKAKQSLMAKDRFLIDQASIDAEINTVLNSLFKLPDWY